MSNYLKLKMKSKKKQNLTKLKRRKKKSTQEKETKTKIFHKSFSKRMNNKYSSQDNNLKDKTIDMKTT